jgi:uncharacterized protein DUF7007
MRQQGVLGTAVSSFKRPVEGGWSPWGTIDGVTELADGIWSISTPHHGGIRLSPARNRRIPRVVRSYGGWYEEDSAWAIPFVAFGDLQVGEEDDKMLDLAINTLMKDDPLGAYLAFGQYFDDRHNVRSDLHRGTLVKWTAKVNEDHVPLNDPRRVYSHFDERGEEAFIDNQEFTSWPLSPVIGLVVGPPKWMPKHRELCYPIVHPLGVSIVSRSYLDPI